MTKVKKAILIFLAFIGCLWLLLHGHKYHIKTEYGDSFTVFCDDFGDLYSICDDNSDFSTGLYYFSDKKQLQAMCDNQYIRCYHILDGREDGYKDKYIFKIKKMMYFLLYVIVMLNLHRSICLKMMLRE